MTLLARAPLYTTSARNTLLRPLLGTPLGDLLPAYNATQLANAKESRDFWASKGAGINLRSGLLGCEDGECSFMWWLLGDHDLAHGIFQWHVHPRLEDIKHYLGIDLLAPGVTHLDMLNAAYGEMTTHWPGNIYYVWNKLLALQDADETAIEIVMVTIYERSGAQARDIQRRTGLANYWVNYDNTVWSVQSA